jgi:hypothetical protein
MFTGQIHYRQHIAWPTSKVNCDDRSGSRRYCLTYGIDSNVAAVSVDIREHGFCARQNNAARRSEVTSRRNDDLVTVTEPQGSKRQLERHRSVGEGDSISSAVKSGEFLLKFFALLTGPVVNLTGFEHGPSSVNLIGLVFWPSWQLSLKLVRRYLNFSFLLLQLTHQR